METLEQTPPPVQELPAGTEVGGYLITQKIGQGGMAEVYEAVHPIIGKRVAIKLLFREFVTVPDLVHRFVEEARAVNTIGHPHIVDIFAFGQMPDGRHFMVMEYLEGETLARRLERTGLAGIALTDLRRWFRQIAEALEAAHRAGFVHRDLKPENIWIAHKGHGETTIKLLDFGIAKLLGIGRRITEKGATIGTPGFMSPEQCLGNPVDQRADIYAFGVILYLVFTGTMPFTGNFDELVEAHTKLPPQPPSQHRPMSPMLENLILDCLEKEPAARPPSARVLGDRLDAALMAHDATALVRSAETVHALPAWALPTTRTGRERFARPLPPRVKRPLVLAVLAALGIAALTTGVWRWRTRQLSPDALAVAGAAALERTREALATLASAQLPTVREAAALRELAHALDVGEDDVATFQDLFSTEDWWRPYREPPRASALVTKERILATTDPALTDLNAAPPVERARAAGPNAGVIARDGRGFLVAAAPVTGFRRRPADGAVVVIAAPIDREVVAELAARTGAGIGLFAGKVLKESAGSPTERAVLVRAALAAPGLAIGRTVLLDGGYAVIGEPLGDDVAIVTAFAPPPLGRDPLALVLGGVGVGALAVAGWQLWLWRRRRSSF
jgi:tRNA A-37 threonylcarbamoyl transferase component Bud32